MDQKTARFVLELLDDHAGNRELTARYMRDSLKIGGIKICRALIADAYAYGYAEQIDYNSEPHVIA